MYKVRARIVSTAQFQSSKFSKIKHVYFIKNTHYGNFCDTTEYNKIQVTFKSERDSYSKNKEGKKSDLSLWRAREKIYQLIEGNTRSNARGRKPIFITLTAKDQEQDIKKSNQKIKK